MRRLGVWGVGTVVLASLGGLCPAGEPPSGGGGKPAVRPIISSNSRKSAAEPARPAGDSTAARKREEAAYWRRVAVCDKLTEIAIQTGDVQLEEAAEQLKQRTFAVYMQRLANLPAVPADDLDEQLLQKHGDKTRDAGARLQRGGRTPPAEQDARAGRLFPWRR